MVKKLIEAKIEEQDAIIQSLKEDIESIEEEIEEREDKKALWQELLEDVDEEAEEACDTTEDEVKAEESEAVEKPSGVTISKISYAPID